MDVVVTGAAGFIGSHVVETLVDRGHSVRAVDCLLPDSYDAAVKRATWDVVTALPGVTGVEADLRSASLDDIVAAADAVVNEAGIAGMSRSWPDVGLYMDLNVTVVGRLLEACARVGARRFIQASTSSVYGKFAAGDESTPLRPASPYGVSNVAAEALLRAYGDEHGIRSTVLRYFSVYGPRQRPDMAYHRFIEAMLDGRPVTVYGDGTFRRSATFVQDVAHATVLAVESDDTTGTFNIAGGRSITVTESIKLLAGALGVEPTVVSVPAPPGEQVETAGLWSAARDALGYRPAVAVEDGIARQAAWHVARRHR